MSQDGRMLSRALLGIGLVLLIISAITLYYHFTFTRSAVRTEGTIVDTVWHDNHSNDVDGDGPWYPVVASRPTPGYTLVLNSNIGSDLYEDNESDRVNVYYPPGHPEQTEVNNPWANSFKQGFVGIAGIIFDSAGLIIMPPSTKRSRGERKSRP